MAAVMMAVMAAARCEGRNRYNRIPHCKGQTDHRIRHHWSIFHPCNRRSNPSALPSTVASKEAAALTEECWEEVATAVKVAMAGTKEAAAERAA